MAHATVPLAEGATPLADEADGEPTSSAPAPGDQTEAAPRPPAETLVTAQRAEEMARYTAALLEPWRRRVEELSREAGLEERAEHLQAELEVTRAHLAEATAPKAPPETESAPAPAQGERRWWRAAAVGVGGAQSP